MLRIKYFGMVAEAVGKDEESFEFSGSTAGQLDQNLKEKYPKLIRMNYKYAVNQSLVNLEEQLHDDDEVALLPPFAGG